LFKKALVEDFKFSKVEEGGVLIFQHHIDVWRIGSKQWTVGKVQHVFIDDAVWIGHLEQQWPLLPYFGIDCGEHLVDQSNVVA